MFVQWCEGLYIALCSLSLSLFNMIQSLRFRPCGYMMLFDAEAHHHANTFPGPCSNMFHMFIQVPSSNFLFAPGFFDFPSFQSELRLWRHMGQDAHRLHRFGVTGQDRFRHVSRCPPGSTPDRPRWPMVSPVSVNMVPKSLDLAM